MQTTEDEDVLFESPAFPNDLAQRPLNPYDTSLSESHRKPVLYNQSSVRGEAKGGASSRSPQPVESVFSQMSLTRTDTYKSTDSDHSFSSISLDDPLDDNYEDYEDYKNWVKVDHVKVPSRPRTDWRHTFS